MKRIHKKLKSIKTEYLIFVFAVLYRLPSLGYDFINNDAFHWKERGYEFGSALVSLNFGKTAVTYHPGVTLLWLQFIANKIYSLLNFAFYHNSLGPREEFFVNHFLQKFVLVVVTSFLVTLVYYQLKKIITDKAALITVLLLLLEPFFVGLSRAIHTDVLLSLFMFLAYVYFYSALAEPFSFKYRGIKFLLKDNRNLVLAGIFSGLACLTKSAALFLYPFFALVLLLRFGRRNIKTSMKLYLLVFSLSAGTFFLLWPAMWVKPFSSLVLYIGKGIKGVAIEEGHGHTWFGKQTTDPGIAFYPVALVARYSVIALAIFLYGIVFQIKRRRDKIPFSIYSILFVVFYIVMITLASKKLSRYSLPVLLPMLSVGAYALVKSVDIKKHFLWIILFLVLRSALLYGLHPDYLAYYSPIVNGVEGGRFVIDPKWPVGYKRVAEYFNKKDHPEKIKVAISEYDYIRPFANFQVVNIKHETERDKADYFVLPIYRPERNKFYTDNYDLEKIRDEISIAGVEYYKIYKNHGKK